MSDSYCLFYYANKHVRESFWLPKVLITKLVLGYLSYRKEVSKQNMEEMKTCNKCGKILPMSKFRLVKGQSYRPYYLNQCKECEYKRQRKYIEEKNKIIVSDNLEILIKRQYKEIKPERILDISNVDIIPLAADEIFVKLADYRNIWLSNYGRVIRCSDGKYNLAQGSYETCGSLRYTAYKNVFMDGKWTWKRTVLYAAKAVVEEFVVNPDKPNNIFIWYKNFDKRNCYYKNLYPLNQEQFRIVKNHFNKTGDNSEEFIVKVMNDIRFKPDDWSRKCMKPTICGIGYHGSDNVNYKSKSYLRWRDMMNRCYNEKFHRRQPQYKGCTVCVEWHNYMNFKVWYDEHKYELANLDLDKDILFKGNGEYSPATAVFVPHAINTLFLNCKKKRGGFPLGVHFDKDGSKYCAETSFMGKIKRLGRFDTPEAAFAKYKEYKEKFIRDMADKYKDKIPDRVYQAMMNWKIEITD